MKRIICTIKTATSPINGIDFGPHERGLVSVPVPDEVAEGFGTIPGYELEPWVNTEPVYAPAPSPAPVESPAPAPEPEPEPETAPAPAAEAPASEAPADQPVDEREALRAELTSLGVAVNNKWGVERLKAEIEAARAAKAGQS